MFAAARVTAYERVKDVLPAMIARLRASVPRRFAGANGYWDFDVPMLPADYVTDDAGTGFVHTAPGHGADDYDLFVKHARPSRPAAPGVPHTVCEDSSYRPTSRSSPARASSTTRARTAGANEAVIDKLVEAGALLARGRLKHSTRIPGAPRRR